MQICENRHYVNFTQTAKFLSKKLRKLSWNGGIRANVEILQTVAVVDVSRIMAAVWTKRRE
jgi:hypothetical protein